MPNFTPEETDAALLGVIEGDLRRSGYKYVEQLARITTRLLERIEELEFELHEKEDRSD